MKILLLTSKGLGARGIEFTREHFDRMSLRSRERNKDGAKMTSLKLNEREGILTSRGNTTKLSKADALLCLKTTSGHRDEAGGF